jgi:ATP-binding cassette, subfamily B, bacterial
MQPLYALWPFLRPYRGVLVLALLALLIASGAMLALPVAVRYLIDHGMASGDTGTVNRYFLAFLGAAVLFGIFAALRFYLVTWLGERVVANVRKAVYDRVVRMDMTFFEVTRTGEILSRLTTDTTLVQSISGVGISITLRSALNLVGALVMMGATSPKLMGIMVVLIPLIMLPLFTVGRKVRKLSRASQDRVADSSGLAGETLNAMQTIQAFTLESLQSRRYGEAVETGFDTAIARNRVRATLTAVGTMLVMAAITLVLWLGARAVLAGDMTGGQLGQFLLYAAFVSGSAAALIEQWGEVQRAAGAMERLVELLQAKSAIAAPELPVALPTRSQGALRFNAVSFHYPSRPDATDSGMRLH